jgi:hypothetical protein
MFSELRHRDPLLFWIGAAMVLALVVCLLISIGDARQILGLNPWIKPMKFLVSVPIFLWTVAWYMPEVRAGAGVGRMASFVRWTIGLAMIVEMICVILQAARGTTSHFNIATAFDAMVFNAMGIGILFNTIAMVVFTAIIRTDTPPHRAGYLWGIRLGLVMFLLASFEGAVIIANNAHTVGAADGGPGLPFVNWSTANGDLRVAHFVGMHAFQGLPLLGFLLDRARVSAARNVVLATGILWFAVMGGLLMMALQGRPLLAL